MLLSILEYLARNGDRRVISSGTVYSNRDYLLERRSHRVRAEDERENEREKGSEGLFAHHSKESAAHRDLPIPRRPQPHAALKSNLHCPPDFELLLNVEEAFARAHFPAVNRRDNEIPAIFERDCLH